MALASTDPRVLMGQAKCFACLTPHQQYILRTYLLALIAMGDTSITGVQALSAASTCFACLTYEELLAAKQYLMAVWLGLDTTKTGIIAQAKAAACDFACLTPKQAEQLRTYLLAVTAGVSTTAAGVRTLEAAAKCFNCLESKQQLEAQVYLLSTLAPGSPTTPAAIMQGAKCYLSCVPPELHEALQTSLFAQVAGRSTPPCVTPTAPGQPSTFSALNNILKISWTQPANPGSLILGYTVSYGTTQGGPYTGTISRPASARNAVISGLTVGTTYYFVVKANSFAGCSSANSTEGSATTTGAPPIVLKTNLLSYWKMDEAVSGNRADSVGANTLLVLGGTCPAGAGIINNGAVAGASFVHQWLTVTPSNSNFVVSPGQSISFSAWFLWQPSGFYNGHPLLSKGNIGLGNAAYYLMPSGGPVTWFATDAASANLKSISSGVDLSATPNTFFYFAFGYDDVNKVIWIQVNAGARQTTPCNGILLEANDFNIGNNAAGTLVATVVVDEVGLWKRVLTTAEVTTLYNGGAGYALSNFFP